MILFHPTPGGDWQASLLEGKSFSLKSNADSLQLERLTEVVVEHTPSKHSAVLIETGDADVPAGSWVALTSGDVSLNGMPVRAGIAVLSDCDELRVGRHRAYVSFEQRATIEVYEADDEPSCSRCHGAIERGQHFVRCPPQKCGCVSHQEEETAALPCWLVRDTCQVCGASTSLDAEFSFAPELL